MEFTFARWIHPSSLDVRVYVNCPELAGSTIKVWLVATPTGGRVITNQRDFFAAAHGLVRRALASRVESGELPTDDLTALTWEQVLSLAPALPPVVAATPAATTPGKPGATSPATSASWRERKGARYTADDAATLDPNRMAHPIPSPVVLLVDHREPAEIIEALKLVRNLEVRVEALPVGDYVALNDLGEPALIVERKTIHDFTQSIVENAKRLFHQTDALRQVEAPAVLLLEGDLYGNTRLSLPAISGTLSYLATIQRVSVIPTMSMAHSVYQIVKMCRHAVFGLGYELGLRGASPDKTPASAAAFTLEGIPGVSATRARGLLERFGSIAAVAMATEAELCEVDGIGPKTARGVLSTLNAGVAPAPATEREPLPFRRPGPRGGARRGTRTSGARGPQASR